MDEVAIEHRLTVIESKVEGGFVQTTAAIVALTEKVGQQNGRIGRIEDWKLQVITVYGGIIVAAPFVFFALNKWFP